MSFDKREAAEELVELANALHERCRELGVPMLLNVVFAETDENYDGQTWGINGGDAESSSLVDQLVFLQRHRNHYQKIASLASHVAGAVQELQADVDSYMGADNEH